jgi:DNA-binding transcriptional MerR regulator
VRTVPDQEELTIDQLAAVGGTTTRRVRSLQTLGLLPHPVLRGRTGLYGTAHRQRLGAIVRLQDLGFSLESLTVLFRAFEEGASLAEVLELPDPFAGPEIGAGTWSPDVAEIPNEPGTDAAELYGFSQLQSRVGAARPRPMTGRPLLSVVPTTVWDESEAS